MPGYGISAQALYTRVEGQWLLWQTPQSSACEAVPLTFSVRRGDAGEASSDCNMIRLDAQITVEVPRYELIAYGSSALFFTPPFDLQRDDSFPRSAALDASGTATFDAGASSSGVSVEISFSFAEAGSGNGEPQLGGFLEVLPTRQSYSFVPYNLCDTPND